MAADRCVQARLFLFSGLLLTDTIFCDRSMRRLYIRARVRRVIRIETAKRHITRGIDAHTGPTRVLCDQLKMLDHRSTLCVPCVERTLTPG